MSKNQKILSTSAWKKVRLSVLLRDMYTCAYCGGEANEVDHVIPLAEDSSNAYNPDGLVAACRRCNNAKGARPVGVFLSRSVTPPVSAGNLSPITTTRVVSGSFANAPKPI